MCSTPLTSCSIGAATVSASTCGFAPGYRAVTITVGGTMSGNWATGSWTIARAPTRTMTMDKTAAKIGRSMKKWENFMETQPRMNTGGYEKDHLPALTLNQ